jgi:hypothetical protein
MCFYCCQNKRGLLPCAPLTESLWIYCAVRTEILNIIPVGFLAWRYTIRLLTHTYKKGIYWLRMVTSNSAPPLPLPIELHLFSFFVYFTYSHVCEIRVEPAAFGLMHLLTAWRHKCIVHYVVSELIFNELVCFLLQIRFNSLLNTEGTPLRVGMSCPSSCLMVQFFCRNGNCIKRRYSVLISGVFVCVSYKTLFVEVLRPIITLKSVRPTPGSREDVVMQRPTVACVIEKGHLSMEILSLILY